MSGDRSRNVHVWLVDSGIMLHSTNAPTACIDVTLNMKYAVLSDGDNSVRIWLLAGGDSGEEKRNVSHAERITCFALTSDSQHVVTGSMDMSLKVWKLDGGKLSQVLVGHSDIVTCEAVSITNKTQIVSGSWDCNLIVWNINTGSDLHLLSGHLGKVTCVKVTGDGTIAVSSAEDKTLIIWETKRGLALTSLSVHVPLLGFQITSDCSRIGVHLLDRGELRAGRGGAAIAQSQHFDQLEALWNKISPPRRRSNKSLTKQNSLIESRFDSSDEEHTPVEE